MSDEFYNFERALDELKLKEEELKRLVSEGEIRAFREGDTMRLRRADVEVAGRGDDGDLIDFFEALEARALAGAEVQIGIQGPPSRE